METRRVGFQPVDPWQSPELKRNHRNLPHLQVEGATYFVTFRCRPRIVLPPPAKSLALSAVRHWDGRRIDLDAAVVMPNHVHALFRILDGSLLENILRSIKSYSAREINRLMGRRGRLWQDERFDHIVRDQSSWQGKIDYIRQNPVRKGLVRNAEEYRWLYVRRLP